MPARLWFRHEPDPPTKSSRTMEVLSLPSLSLMERRLASGLLAAGGGSCRGHLLRLPRARLLRIRLVGRNRGEDALEKPHAVGPLLWRLHRKRARDRRLPDGDRLGVHEHPATLHYSQRLGNDVSHVEWLLPDPI